MQQAGPDLELRRTRLAARHRGLAERGLALLPEARAAHSDPQGNDVLERVSPRIRPARPPGPGGSRTESILGHQVSFSTRAALISISRADPNLRLSAWPWPITRLDRSLTAGARSFRTRATRVSRRSTRWFSAIRHRAGFTCNRYENESGDGPYRSPRHIAVERVRCFEDGRIAPVVMTP
jgi:hypothetical protein